MGLQKELIPVFKTGKGSDTLQLINQIYRDNNNILWTYNNENIFRLDSKTMQPVKSYPYDFKEMNGIFQDKQNRYWVCTGLGKLFLFDEKSGNFSNFKIPAKERSHHPIEKYDEGFFLDRKSVV